LLHKELENRVETTSRRQIINARSSVIYFLESMSPDFLIGQTVLCQHPDDFA